MQGFIRSGNRLRRDIFAHIVKLPIKLYKEQRSGALSNRVSADLGIVRDTLLNAVPQAVRHTVILFIFISSWQLSLIMPGSVRGWAMDLGKMNTIATGRPSTRTMYDDFGEASETTIDSNGDGSFNNEIADSIKDTVRRVESLIVSESWPFRRSRSRLRDNAGQDILLATVYRSVDGGIGKSVPPAVPSPRG